MDFLKDIFRFLWERKMWWLTPIFHTPVYLVSKDKTDTVTRFFTKRVQSLDKGLIFGRAFHPTQRAPQAGVEFSLSGRNSRPLYYGALPNVDLKETTDSGLFSFFNVEPSFRSLSKVGVPVSALINVRPGEAYYVEMGRSGTKSLHGRLYDPFRQSPIEGQVTIVGSDLTIETDEKGVFEIPGVELSAGILTLEIKAPGYPITWHTLPWSHRESEKTALLHMVEEDFFKETRESIARIVDDRTMGSLFGGADPRLFNRAGKCVYVSLEDDRGRAPIAAHGPFPLSQPEKAVSSPLCLTHANPGFSYFNLPAGEYLLKWRSESGRLLRSHVLHIGVNRTSIAVN